MVLCGEKRTHRREGSVPRRTESKAAENGSLRQSVQRQRRNAAFLVSAGQLLQQSDTKQSRMAVLRRVILSIILDTILKKLKAEPE